MSGRTSSVNRLEWIIDGYVLGEYDLFECGARLGRAVTAALVERDGGRS